MGLLGKYVHLILSTHAYRFLLAVPRFSMRAVWIRYTTKSSLNVNIIVTFVALHLALHFSEYLASSPGPSLSEGRAWYPLLTQVGTRLSEYYITRVRDCL